MNAKKDGQDHDRLRARSGLAPAGAQLLAPAAYQAGDEIYGPLRHGKPDLVDNTGRALGGRLLLHTGANSRRGPSCYGRNRPDVGVRANAPSQVHGSVLVFVR